MWKKVKSVAGVLFSRTAALAFISLGAVALSVVFFYAFWRLMIGEPIGTPEFVFAKVRFRCDSEFKRYSQVLAFIAVGHSANAKRYIEDLEARLKSLGPPMQFTKEGGTDEFNDYLQAYADSDEPEAGSFRETLQENSWIAYPIPSVGRRAPVIPIAITYSDHPEPHTVQLFGVVSKNEEGLITTEPEVTPIKLIAHVEFVPEKPQKYRQDADLNVILYGSHQCELRMQRTAEHKKGS
jgi:hypothetical protein